MSPKLKRLCDPPSTKAALEIVRQDGTIIRDYWRNGMLISLDYFQG